MSAIPRFGMTSDFASLGYLVNEKKTAARDTQSSGEDYLVGLSYIAGAILAVFLVWWFFLLICKCCCRNFLSGSPFSALTAPPAGDSEEIDVEADEAASIIDTMVTVNTAKKEDSSGGGDASTETCTLKEETARNEENPQSPKSGIRRRAFRARIGKPGY